MLATRTSVICIAKLFPCFRVIVHNLVQTDRNIYRHTQIGRSQTRPLICSHSFTPAVQADNCNFQPPIWFKPGDWKHDSRHMIFMGFFLIILIPKSFTSLRVKYIYCICVSVTCSLIYYKEYLNRIRIVGDILE